MTPQTSTDTTQYIGKTLFLFYVLVRRLQERKTVALQINRQQFALFDERGVCLHSSICDYVPEGAWALSDQTGEHELCAFTYPFAHVIRTGYPAAHGWKGWVKRLSARQYIMDVWSLQEFRTLLYMLSSFIYPVISLTHSYQDYPQPQCSRR